MKDEILNNLRAICEEKKEKYKAENNASKIKIFEAITKILSDEDCFEKMDAEVAINILLDLGFDAESSAKIFSELLKD